MKDKSAKTIASALYHDLICIFPSISRIYSDNEPSLNSAICVNLRELTSIIPTFSSSYHPESNGICESKGCGRLGRLLRAICAGSDRSWETSLKSAQLVANTTYRDPRSMMTPTEAMGFGKGSAMYSPVLIFWHLKNRQMEEYWSEPMHVVAEIIRRVRRYYYCYLTIDRPRNQSLENFNIRVGSRVYYRVFTRSTPMRGLRSLLPRYELGKVITVFGPTAVAILSDHGTILSRHISDLRAFTEGNRYAFPDNYDDNEITMAREEKGLDLHGGNRPVTENIHDGADRLTNKNGQNCKKPTAQNGDSDDQDYSIESGNENSLENARKNEKGAKSSKLRGGDGLKESDCHLGNARSKNIGRKNGQRPIKNDKVNGKVVIENSNAQKQTRTHGVRQSRRLRDLPPVLAQEAEDSDTSS